MNRRDAMTTLASSSLAAAGALVPSTVEALTPNAAAAAGPSPTEVFQQAVKGTGPVKIRDVKTILTAPNRIRLVIVKIETTEPGLVGWGCATFTQRALVVKTAIDEYLRPFLTGRNVDEIEDIWQSSYMSSYWRNGGILFNAMSGVDIALWDIKAKRAGMPLYQLLGGKVRHGADCYYHASGASFTEVEESARTGMERGFRHVRVQVSTPGYASYGAPVDRAGQSCRGVRRGDRSDEPASDLGVGAVRPHAAEVLRAPAHETWRRSRVAARRARARDVESGDQLVQVAGAVSPLLPRGSISARGQRALPAAAPADQYPAGDGRVVQHAARVPAAHQGSVDRLHPHPHLANRWPEPGTQSGCALRGTSACAPPGMAPAMPHRLPTRRSSPSSSPATTLACTRAVVSRKKRWRCSSAVRRSRTATCSRRKSLATASKSTRNSRRNSRSRLDRQTSTTRGERRGARTAPSFGRESRRLAAASGLTVQHSAVARRSREREGHRRSR